MSGQDMDEPRRAACARLFPSGTAFLVAPRLLACCSHSVRKDEIKLQFHSESAQRSAKVIGRNARYDCALLELDEESPTRPLAVNLKTPESSLAWRGFGFSTSVGVGTGLTGTVTESGTDIVDDKGLPAIQLYCPQAGGGEGAKLAGYSGTPILIGDEVYGFIRGFIYNKEKFERCEQGLIWACPSKAIHELAKEHDREHELHWARRVKVTGSLMELTDVFYPSDILTDAQHFADDGSFIAINGSRGFGKTRLLKHLEAYISRTFSEPRRIVDFDMELFNSDHASADAFLRGLAVQLCTALELSGDLVETAWRLELPSPYRLRHLLKDILERQLSGIHLVLSFDHLDRIGKSPGIEALASTIRAWASSRKSGDQHAALFRRVQVLLASSTPIDLLRPQSDLLHKSPLAGTVDEIQLRAFDVEGVKQLAENMNIQWNQTELFALFGWLKGHPALTYNVLKRAALSRRETVADIKKDREMLDRLIRLGKHYGLNVPA